MASRAPTRIRIRMYQVGFGDCFLLSFEYAKAFADDEGVQRDLRHVLVDFGSTHGPKRKADGGKTTKMSDVAEAIAADCGGRLDVLVATHRHADHVSAFGHDATADVIEGLRPGLVVQPWTEHPDAATDALFPFAPEDQGFLAALGLGQSFAEQVATALGDPSSNSNAARLKSLAELQFTNEAAVTRLWSWAEGGKGRYLFAGQPSGIEDVVPGVQVTVLGPPTVKQWADVARQRDEHEEYWSLYKGLLAGGSMASLAATAAAAVEDAVDDADAHAAALAKVESVCAPGPTRWLIERMRGHGVHTLERLVHSLDNAMNNTSLVLLFEVGGKKGRRLLFPGDAQIENWGYGLDLASKDKKLRAALSTVDLYKVGHHGSRNATPKTLHRMWTEPAVAGLPFTALMSTRVDVHGDSPVTEVPSASLVEALKARTDMHSTQDLDDGERCLEVVADVKGDAPFERVV